jgi:hypothetical protein
MVLQNINHQPSQFIFIICLKIGIVQTALGLLNETVILIVRDRYASAWFPLSVQHGYSRIIVGEIMQTTIQKDTWRSITQRDNSIVLPMYSFSCFRGIHLHSPDRRDRLGETHIVFKEFIYIEVGGHGGIKTQA